MAIMKLLLLVVSICAVCGKQALRGGTVSVKTRSLKNRYYYDDNRDQQQARYQDRDWEGRYDNARYEREFDEEPPVDDSQIAPEMDYYHYRGSADQGRFDEPSDDPSVDEMDRERQWTQYDQDRYYDQQQYYEQHRYNDRYYDRYYDNERDYDGHDQHDVAYTAFADGLPLATGYKKSSKEVTVTVGYSNAATHKVPKNGDALPALNAAMKAITPKGGIVSVEAGTYILSSQYIMTANNTWLRGAGQDKTILKLTNKAAKFKYAGFLRGRFLRDLTISDITLDGNRKGQDYDLGDEKLNYGRYGFYMDGFTNLLMTRMTIQNFQSYGFDPHGIKPNPTIFSTRVTITNCISRGNGWDGFTLDQIVGVYVANCLAENNGRHGFNVVTGSKNVVVKNCIANNNGFGRRVYKSGNGCGYVANDDNFGLGTSDVLFEGNLAKNSFKGGVCLLEPTNVVIKGNTFDTAPVCGHFAGSRTYGIQWQNNKCINTKTIIYQFKDVRAGAITGIPKSDASRDWSYMG